jgi:RNA polymerase sigma factor (sigma-70 family)
MSPNRPHPAAAAEAWSARSQRLGQWLARVALGDRAALAALYADTSRLLYGVILRIVDDAALAEDVLQEVYVNVWRGAGSFDAARSQPLTWLVSVARHRAIDALRQRRSEPATVSLHRDDDDGDTPGLLDTLPDGAPGPLERLAAAASARGVTQCMDALSKEQQQCLALVYYRGLSHAEVSSHLSQPLGTVKSWVRRALLALRDCLGRAGLVEGT